MIDLGRNADAGDALTAVVRDSSVAECVRRYCERQQIAGATIHLCDNPLGEAPVAVNGGKAVILIEAGEIFGETIEQLEKLNRHVAGKGALIVILDDPDAQVLRRLFRAGVTDVLPAPAAEADIVAALDAARRSRESALASGKIITVLKSAGGVGATTVAVNSAREIHDLTGGRVALIDLDLQFGTDGLALDVQSRMDITDAIRAGDRLDGTLLRSLMTRHKSGLDILPAASSITPLDVMSEEFTKNFLRQLRGTYDFVIVETPAAWCHWFGALFDESDILAPVVETSVRSADGSSRIMQGFADLSIRDPKLFVVANRYVNKPESKDRLRKLSDIYGVKVEGQLRADEKVAADASDLGKCLKDVAPSAPIAGDVSATTERMLARFGVSPAQQTEVRSAAKLRRLLPGVMQKRGEAR